ncbi:MAG: LytTR family transcriptional regulator DNA-binding domain-containing protein [Chitinophagaceae bacterium]
MIFIVFSENAKNVTGTSAIYKQNFFRIHHSTLINLHRVQEFQRFDGSYVVMENKVKLEVSMRKRKNFLEALNEMML